MKVLVVSDTHGDLQHLEYVLAEEEEFDMFAHDSAIAEAADGLADKEWIRKVVEAERQKYLPAVVEQPVRD